MVDNEDYVFLIKSKWHAVIPAGSDGTRVYAATNIKIGDKRRPIGMHRIITNAPKGKDVDHKNHNCLDNRKKNLRICTRQENLRNKGKNPSNKSGYKGVFLCKTTNRWRVQISSNNQHVSLGRFTSKIKAAKAYDKAAKKLHGKFALLNFPNRPKEKSRP